MGARINAVVAWLREERNRIPSYFVSAAIAGIAGVAFSWSVGIWAQEAPEFAVVNPNSLGIGRPALLFHKAASKGSIRFEPPEFAQVKVCEFSLVRGVDQWDIAISYLERYSQCFVVSKQGPRSIRIRPNRFSGHFRQEGNNYYCKCSEETIAKDRRP